MEGLERKLAQEVDSLRGEIGSVKRDVDGVKKATEQGFSSVLAKLDAMRATPALPAPDPAALPLPSDGLHLLAEGDEPTGDSRPLGDWSEPELVARIESLGGSEAVTRLAYAKRGDLVAALSHQVDVHVVYQHVSGGWRVGKGRVVAVDPQGGLGWGLGVDADTQYVGGRQWRGEGAEGHVLRAVAYSSLYLCPVAATRDAENVSKSLSQSSPAKSPATP